MRLWIASLGLVLLGCSRGTSNEPKPLRLVVLYSTCTLDRAFLEPYAGEDTAGITPNLAAFAEESLVFTKHTTEAGQSGIDFAALFSGVQAPVHGVYAHPKELSLELTVATEVFAAAGYESYYWSGQPMAALDLNYAQGVSAENGFDHARQFRKKATGIDPEDLAHLTATDDQLDRVLERLKQDAGARAFVQTAFTITHNPYHHYVSTDRILEFGSRHPRLAADVTREELERFLPLYERNRHALQLNHEAAVSGLQLSKVELGRLAACLRLAYGACVEQLDERFGLFLERIRAAGLEDESLIVFTADHGELLYRENALFQWGHGMQLAPEVLGVPLIVRAPGHVKPGRFDAVTRSVDVLPTLAGLSGVTHPDLAAVEGVDLAPVLRGEREAPELVAFSHTTTMGKGRVRRFANMQGFHRFWPRVDPELIWVRARKGDLACKLRPVRIGASPEDSSWRFELYDLGADPGETNDLFDPELAEHAQLRDQLLRYKARLIEGYYRGEQQAGEGGLSEEEALERLKALGYVR